MLPRITQTIQEALQLSPQQLAFRVGYEVLNRSGLRERLEPLGQAPSLPETPSYQEWWDTLPKGHLLCRWRQDVESGIAKKVLTGLLSDDEQHSLIERADRAIRGKIRAFSRWEADYGSPIDWHRNPIRDVSWPRDLHWSKVYGFENKGGGDIKMVWEINRFPHVYDLARAYILTGDSRYPRAFFDQLRSWEAANPFRGGANWASGQELAIRSLSWLFGLAVMGADSAVKEADFQRLLRLFYLHGLQIDGQISYARYAVHNNHLIGEALGLLVIGSLFPFFREAGGWQNDGRKLLLNDSLEQFYDDGGYCQSSHTYQRLALHYLLWTRQFLDQHECAAQPRLEQILQRSAKYLASFQNLRDGRLPNRGANDGALLNPWTSCDYADFRPLLTTLRFATAGQRAYPDGPWDEELFWFFGEEALRAPIKPFALEDKSFPTSGIHVLRQGPDNFATFRCGTLRDRFGQADQLHVDIFWRGINIAQDGGSYCYNDEPEFHRWFMGTSSHNTITVDDLDQMELIRRFKWVRWTRAFSPGVNEGTIRGQHFGYANRGVIHHRSLTAITDGWEIIDKVFVSSERPTKLTLQWLLGDFPFQFIDENPRRLCLNTPQGPLYLHWTIEDLRTGADLSAQAIQTIERGVETPSPRGWFSRYYGIREPAPSFQLTLTTGKNVRFISRFITPGDELIP